MKERIINFIGYICVAFWTAVLYVRITLAICLHGGDDSVTDEVIAALGRREIKRPSDTFRIIKAWENGRK